MNYEAGSSVLRKLYRSLASYVTILVNVGIGEYVQWNKLKDRPVIVLQYISKRNQINPVKPYDSNRIICDQRETSRY
jgi:hypothetical protein